MKIKVSILTRIALLFMAALIAASAIIFSVSQDYILEKAAKQAETVAKAAATAAMTAIGSGENIRALYDDEAFREKIHKSFRFICRRTGLRYLYLYTTDEDGYKHYIVCAANGDEDDARMQDEYGFGSVRMVPFFQAEMDVLDQKKDEAFELVDNDYGFVCMNILPLRGKDGSIIALIGADYYIDNIRNLAKENLNNMLQIGFLVIIVAFVIALVLIQRSVIRPILALSKRMRRFISDGRENVDAEERKTIYEDEMTDIENAFDQMTKDINHYVSDIEALTRERLYNQTQLDVASKIQSGIVPGEYLLSGDRFDVYGCMYAAREVGGDFYDIFRLDDGRISVVIGDISDKGITAALFMSIVKTTIREKLKAGLDPADALNRVNRELCESNPENMFATVFALILDPEIGIVSYANAGHEKPLMLGKEPSYLNVISGIALGLFEDSDIVEEKLVLRNGDGILLYTDGITEAIDGDRRQYGKERLRETVSREYREDTHSYDARALVVNVVASVREYTRGLEQFDDITCLALIYRDPECVQIPLTPDIASFDILKDYMLSSLGESAHTKKIILACEEIFSNIVSYSKADQVSFSGRRCQDAWLITFEDNGIPFDPVKVREECREFEELDQGGMGIMFARRNSRSMVYSRIDDRNVLMMVFDADERRASPRTDVAIT